MKNNIKKGRFIVIEGNDGSGKSTQVSLLIKYLNSKKYPVKTLDFPRYYDSFFGKFIGGYLRGEYGELKEVNPYLITFPYALDRATVGNKIKKWISQGNFLVFNRYIPSNLSHQSGRLPKKERKKFVDWNIAFEYGENKMPKEDMVIFLHVPYKFSLSLMQNKNRKNRNYTKGKKDMVEENLDYIKNSEEAYLELAKRFPHWKKVECVKDGKLRSIEDIHEEIRKILKV